MRLFCSLLKELSVSTEDYSTTLELDAYLKKAGSKDALWAIYLLSGRRPRRTFTISEVRDLAHELIDLPIWLFEESLNISGNLAETISILTPTKSQPFHFSLTDLMITIKSLRNLDKVLREKEVLSMISGLERDQCYFYIKLITGGFRIDLSSKVLVECVAKFSKNKIAFVAHQLASDWSPESISLNDLFKADPVQNHISSPYLFHISQPIKKKSLLSLGPLSAWSLEWDWDGLRAQLVIRKGQIYLWSSDQELITSYFPEFQSLQGAFKTNVVLEGSIVSFINGIQNDFDAVNRRLKRKKINNKIINENPVLFIGYDILEADSVDLRSRTFEQRRSLLENLFGSLSGRSTLVLSNIIGLESWSEVPALLDKSRIQGARGLIIKHKKSTYGNGNKKMAWRTLNAEPMRIIAVLVYVSRAQNINQVYSEFTAAVWNDDELIPFVKVVNTLCVEEIDMIRQFAKNNTLESFGPVRSIKPNFAIEISFDGIALSKRHKCGLKLRNPKLIRLLDEKSIDKTNSLKDLHSFLNLYNPDGA